MRAAWPTLLLLAACGGEDPGPEPTLEDRLAAQPGFWFEAPSPSAREQRLRELAELGYADGYEPSHELEREFIELCANKLEEYMVPTAIMFREDLPMTTLGKVDRGAVIAEVDERIKELMGGGEMPDEL